MRAVGLPERAPADGTKYDKYVYHYNFEKDEYYARWRPPAPAEGSDEAAGREPVRGTAVEVDHPARHRRDGGQQLLRGPLGASARGVDARGWDIPLTSTEDAELIWVIGGDPEHPEELGAEVEVFMGPEMERHIIDKTCVIYIPPYFMHCPWRILRT